ncbi:MAG: methylenetetrahydrofolate reductase, partial [Candidatus Hodarchaeales archaeon]
ITCVGHSKKELIEILDKMKTNGIINVLALRGDSPRDEKEWKPELDGFSFAYQLCDLVKSYGDLFSCGVAGFPEGHPEAPNKEADIKYLKNKIDHGGEFVITQLFYDNRDYFEYVSQVRNIGVENRIIPGILPIMNFKSVEKFCSFIEASIPPRLYDIFTPIKDDLEITRKKGVQVAIEQCSALLDGGAPGLHFYTLNKLDPIKKIVNKLKPYFE